MHIYIYRDIYIYMLHTYIWGGREKGREGVIAESGCGAAAPHGCFFSANPSAPSGSRKRSRVSAGADDAIHLIRCIVLANRLKSQDRLKDVLREAIHISAPLLFQPNVLRQLETGNNVPSPATVSRARLALGVAFSIWARTTCTPEKLHARRQRLGFQCLCMAGAT